MRKLIALCVAVAAMASFGALSAASASAAVGDIDFACAGISTQCFVKGEQKAENTFKVNGGTVKCTKAIFEGGSSAAEGGTAVKTVVGGGTDWAIHSLKVHPTYSGCTFIGQTATVTTTGCNYVITPTSLTAGAVVISCEAGKEIVVEATTSKCTVKVGSQTPISNLVDFTVEGTTTKDVLVTATVGPETPVKGASSGIKCTSSGGACGESGENGGYRGTVTTKGYSDAAHEVQKSATLVKTVSNTEVE